MPILIIEPNPRFDFTSIGDVTGRVFAFDALLSANHGDSAEVTDHPVENGANFSDHIQIKPAQVRLSGRVTNTPIDASESTPADRSLAGP